MKQKHEIELALDIDYDLFTTEELVKIFNFYRFMMSTKHRHYLPEEIINHYNEYRNMINNQALQKKYDQKFKQITGISIYQIITDLGYKY